MKKMLPLLLLLFKLFILIDIISCLEIPSFLATTSDGDDDNKQQWISMTGKQTIQVQVQGLDSGPISSWQVEEFVSMKDDIAYSRHVSLDTEGHSFELLAHGLRNYITSGPNFTECKLDHRQDQLTLFPWRHLAKQRGVEVGPLVIGLGAVWLNAIDQKAQCNVDLQGDESTRQQVLTCQLVDERRLVRANLTFDWRPEEDDGQTSNWRLRRVHVYHQQTVHLDRTLLLQDTNVDVDISSMERSLAIGDKMRDRLQKLIKNCRESISTSETIFPSLMRRIAESHRRNYWFSYHVSLYEPHEANDSHPPTGIHATLKEKFRIQEHFSYELGRQSIIRSTANSAGTNNTSQPEVRFDSLFKFQNPFTRSTLAYRSIRDTEAHECLVVPAIDDPLGSMSILSRRTMRFLAAGHQHEIQMHPGALMGLGALLMNAADIRSKISPQVDGFTVIRTNKWSNLTVIWLIEDQIEGLEFYLYLLLRQRGHQHNCFTEVDDLIKIEVKKSCHHNKDIVSVAHKSMGKGKLLDSNNYHSCASQVMMVIDILDFSTDLDPAELDEAFILPSDCPPTMQFQPPHTPASDNDATTTSNSIQEKDFDDNEEEDYEFPAFEQFIELSRDYSIISDWDLANKQNLFELWEHQRLGLDEEILLNRIDVNGLIEYSGSYKLYVNRSTLSTKPDGPMFRVEEGECKLVDQMDNWLENLAYDSPTLGHRLFGVRALWALASQSPYVEYLGKSNDQRPTWRLADEPRLINMSAMFRFVKVEKLFKDATATATTMYHSLRLDSIEIDSSKTNTLQHLNPIKINAIQFKAQHKEDSTFALPFSCANLSMDPIDVEFSTESSSSSSSTESQENGTSKEEEKEKEEEEEPTFKFPSFENEFGGSPSEVTFIMRYNYAINLDNTSLTFEAIEAHKIQDLGTLELRPTKNPAPDGQDSRKIRLWVTEEGQTLLEEPSPDYDDGGRCRQVQQLAEFMLLGGFLEILGADHPDLHKPGNFSTFALASVWELFGARVEAEQDHQGSLPGRVEFRYLRHEQQAQWFVADYSESHNATIEFTFNHDSTRLEGQNLILQTVILKSMVVGDLEELIKFEMLDATGLLVDPMIRYLPAECSRCLEKVFLFPNLGSLMKATDNADGISMLHIRSESTSNYCFEGYTTESGEGSKFYLLDEYYDPKLGRFRSRTSYLRHNFDYLIHNFTREFFDLSQEFQCQTRAPSASSPSDTADWILDNLFDAVHYGSFHGPLALWLLAGRPHMKLEPAFDELDIMSLGEGMEQAEDWFGQQKWLITHKFNDKVAYTMQFDAAANNNAPAVGEQMIRLIDQLPIRVESRYWYQVSTQRPLRRRWRYGGGNRVNNGLILGDVVQVMSQFDPQELRIPIGRGCKRNEAARQEIRLSKMDLMSFAPLSPVEFEYEASLHLVDGRGAFVPTPVVHSGWFGRCPGLAPFGLLAINHQRSHYMNGTMRSQKLLLSADSLESQNHYQRLLDERQGFCSIWQEYQSPSQVLKLNFGTKDASIILDNSLLRRLGTVSDELERIQMFNSTSSRGNLITQVVYEERLVKFSLNDQLRGLTSIIKSFERSSAEDKQQSGQSIFHHHDSVKLEVLVLGKARLTMLARRLYHRDCYDIFLRADTESCYQSTELIHDNNNHFPSPKTTTNERPKLRSFSMKMSLVANDGAANLNGLRESEWFRAMLKRSFVNKLLGLRGDQSQLKPTQVGQILVNDAEGTDQSNQIVIIKFNLMEPPEAIEYFTRLPGLSIKSSGGLQRTTNYARRIIRILSTKFVCSRWCDSIECLAFSYCQSDRSCQVIKDNNNFALGTDPNQQLTNGFGFGLADNDKSCDYYHAPEVAGRRRALAETIDLIRAQVEGFSSEPGNFILTVPTIREPNTKSTIQLAASEFTEITPNGIELFDVDTRPRPEKIDGQQSVSYTVLRANGFIEAQRLEPAAGLVSEILHTWTLVDCFEKCSSKKDQCQLFSYCAQKNLCTTLGNISDWSTLERAIGGTEQQQTLDNSTTFDGCSIYSVDFLLAYREFDGTMKPNNYELEIDNVSALECAAICDLGRLGTVEAAAADVDGKPTTGSGSYDCLSFDYCVNYSTPIASNTKTTRSGSKCYLQKMHILMDSFDDSIMKQQQKHSSSNTTGNIRCSHHSKSLVADYDHLSGRRFVEHRSIVFKGTELDLCALICRRDDTCLAFEHCHHKLDHKQPNSCYIRRQSRDENELVQRDYGADKLELDPECSVFRVKHFSEEYKFERSQGPNTIKTYEPNYNNWLEQITSQSHFRAFIEFASVLGALFCAMVMGSLIHIMYIMITGDRLPYFQ